MKTLLALSLVMLNGCHAMHANYSGGDGKSLASAVIIKNVKDDRSGHAAVRTWLSERYPHYAIIRHITYVSGQRTYDEFEISTGAGNKTVYFDITEFFRW